MDSTQINRVFYFHLIPARHVKTHHTFAHVVVVPLLQNIPIFLHNATNIKPVFNIFLNNRTIINDGMNFHGP